MTDQHAELDAALERVITPPARHLAAVKAADGPGRRRRRSGARTSSSTTPPTTTTSCCSTRSARSPRGTSRRSTRTRPTSGSASAADGAPRPTTRTRRSSRCASAATTGCRACPRCCGWPRRPAAGHAGGRRAGEPVETVGEAVLELLQAGDGSLGALDMPELEPLDGVVVVAEVGAPLDLEAYEDDDGAGPFPLGGRGPGRRPARRARVRGPGRRPRQAGHQH